MDKLTPLLASSLHLKITAFFLV